MYIVLAFLLACLIGFILGSLLGAVGIILAAPVGFALSWYGMKLQLRA